MKRIIPFLLYLIICNQAFAQKVYTKNASISFFSKTKLENIDANNNQVMSVLNTQTGDLQFSVLIKAFHFKKALMQEHFNENYMESNKFPKATFKGIVNDVAKIDLSKDGSYNVSVSGEMTIHGVTQKISAPGLILVKNGIPTAISRFQVKLKDYRISVPRIVKDNIAEIIDISVNSTYDQKL